MEYNAKINKKQQQHNNKSQKDKKSMELKKSTFVNFRQQFRTYLPSKQGRQK